MDSSVMPMQNYNCFHYSPIEIQECEKAPNSNKYVLFRQAWPKTKTLSISLLCLSRKNCDN
jgi:hypothetical protein